MNFSSRLKLQWILLAIVVVAVLAIAGARSSGPLTTQERAVHLKSTTQCPVCDGQAVSESNAPIAASIRVQIDDLIQQGYNDSQIRARLADAYGDDVLMNPPAGGVAGLVWVLPVVLVVIAGGILAVRIASSEGVGAKSVLTHKGVVMSGVVVLAIGMGVGVGQLSGERLDGQSITSDLTSSSSSLLLEAEELGAEGEVLLALKVYDEILETEPQNPFALARRAWLLIQTGEPEFRSDARLYLERALAVDPELAETYLYLGLLNRLDGDNDAAVVAYTRFLELAGDEAPPEMRNGIEGIIEELSAS